MDQSSFFKNVTDSNCLWILQNHKKENPVPKILGNIQIVCCHGNWQV